ncbi:unnamed protein product [Cylindrotheca closterium]|uniref:Uncharacterized protein n=1 Tax=Cylindrotheca closterium TaxID=2856 RepID=A0AAD2JPP1_9STRA|nr:unnamed protein product [Cylindrotheca closterium]
MDVERANLLRRIKENEIQELVVTKIVARLICNSPQDLVSALQQNTSIENCSVILRVLNPEQIQWEQQVEFLQAIASLASLKEFRFATTSSGFTDSALRLLTVVLNGCSRLEKLTLQTIQPNHDGLTSEVFTNGAGLLSEFRGTLSKQASLETLSLDGIDERFDLGGVMEVLQSLPSIRHVYLKAQAVTNRYDRDTMKCFLQSRAAGASTLSLKRFLMPDILSPYFSLLATNSTLLDLCLEQVGVNGEGCGTLAQSLSQNSTLERLSLAYNGLSDVAGCILFSSLKSNAGLTDLNIAGNFLSTDSCQALADLLGDPSSLSVLANLNLAQNILIRDDGACIIASALASDKRIRHLNLSEMRLSKITSAILETNLASNHTLQRLNFSKNSLGESGAAHMANLLRDNRTLLHLNLSDTKIGPKGSEALAKTLTEDNDTLISLNLGGNSMILYPRYLEAMILSNCTLQHLWLASHLLENDSPIPAFLKLNKFGRSRMLQERNNSLLWKSALVEFASDLGVSYYLLRMNPAIISWI